MKAANEQAMNVDSEEDEEVEDEAEEEEEEEEENGEGEEGEENEEEEDEDGADDLEEVADDDPDESANLETSQEQSNGELNGELSLSADKLVGRDNSGFWAGVLTAQGREVVWDVEGGAQMDDTDCFGDPDFVEFTLTITNFSIDHRTAKEPQTVQVQTNHTGGRKGEWYTLAFLSKEHPCLHTKVTFTIVDRPVVFRLSEGNGPVTISGRLVSKVNEVAAHEALELKDVVGKNVDLDDEDEDDDDEDDEDGEEEEEEEDEEEPQPKSKHIAVRSDVSSMRNPKRGHISPANLNPPSKKARNGAAAANGSKRK